MQEAPSPLHHAPHTLSEVILVVGMHRSGTSALAGVFSRLAGVVPATLMRPASDNRLGFFESEVLCRLHDDMLGSAGATWDDFKPLDPDWMGSEVAQGFEPSLGKALEEEFGQSGLAVVKDPRLCRLLPFWRSFLEGQGIVPKIVIPVRNPLEVAASLSRRHGFSQRRGILIWLRHVLEAESASRGLPRVFLTYEGLLADWRDVAARVGGALGIAWPRWSGAVEAEIDGFIQATERHHTSVTSRTGVGWADDVYAALLSLERGEEDPDAVQARLDATAVLFNEACRGFAPLVEEVDRLRGELAAAQRHEAAAKQSLSDRSAELEETKVLIGKTALASAGYFPGHERSQEVLSSLAERLKISGVVDADWYLARNPDVASAGMDPAEHYLRHGFTEGRMPCKLPSSGG